jgi:hypothetical protein
MYKKWSLLFLSLLWSCQPSGMGSISASAFVDLEREYAGFSTQALTANYLGRKIRHWIAQENGEGMRREMEFARLKHPGLLTAIMADDALCNAAIDFAEITAYSHNSPNFESYIQEFSCNIPPIVGEFHVNTYTTNVQTLPDVAMDAQGNFVVAWFGAGPGDGQGIFARRYNADGEAQGSEFLVNTTTANAQNHPTIAMAPDGDFVIAWASARSASSGYVNIAAQRFDANANKIGGEIAVNTELLNYSAEKVLPDIALSDDGQFVVVWSVSNPQRWYVRQFDANGQPLATEFISPAQIGESERQYNPQIALGADGQFTVAWNSLSTIGPAANGYFQRYSSNGMAQGGIRQFQTQFTGYIYPALAAIPGGNDFLLAWQRLDGNSYGAFAQRFDASGDGITGVLQANIYVTNVQHNADLAVDVGGNFIVTWQGVGVGDSSGIYGRRFNSAAEAQDSEFRVNTYTASTQQYPAVAKAQNNHGQFVVVWESNGNPGEHSSGIYAQRYSSQGAAR